MTQPQTSPMNTEPVQAPAEAKEEDQNTVVVDTQEDVLNLEDAPMIPEGSDVAVVGLATEGILRETFPRLGAALDSVLGLLSNSTPNDKPLGNYHRLEGILASTDYMTLGPLLVDVPEGLNTDYLTYLKVVEKLYKHVARVQTEVLTPLQKHLGQLISMSHHRYVYNPVLDRSIRKFDSERNEIRGLLNKCFTDSAKTKLHYDRAFKRNGDWGDVYDVVERTQRLSRLPVEAIQKQVQEISELTNHLTKLVNEGEVASMDQQTLSATQYWIEVAAEEVSMISVGYYHVNAATTCLNNIVKQLIKNYG